jgi:hypothetical protein
VIQGQNDERPNNMERQAQMEEAPVRVAATETAEETLCNELKAADAEVQGATREFENARAVLAAARANRNSVRNKEASLRKSRPANEGIVAYLKSQNEARMERAKKMQALREAGIDLRVLGKSPLDVAIAQRKRVEGAPSHTPKPFLKPAGRAG